MIIAAGGNHSIVYFAGADVGRVVDILIDTISDILIHVLLEGISDLMVHVLVKGISDLPVHILVVFIVIVVRRQVV
jgi:hypothetical protein